MDIGSKKRPTARKEVANERTETETETARAETADTEQTDAFLEAARRGDKAALEALLSRYMQPIYRFGMQMCRNEEDAKEVLQDTLLAAARTVSGFRGEASVSSWLYTIARSFCIKRRRRSKHAPKELVSLNTAVGDGTVPILRADDSGPDEAAANRQLSRALSAAIAALAPAYRDVLVLRDVEGLTAPEAAGVLGLKVEAVKSRLHRARLSVREQMARFVDTRGGVTGAKAGRDCRDVVRLYSQHLEGEVDAATCAQMEKHLEGCPRCTAMCDSLKQTLALCKSSGPEIPPEVQQSVRSAVRGFLALADGGRPR